MGNFQLDLKGSQINDTLNKVFDDSVIQAMIKTMTTDPVDIGSDRSFGMMADDSKSVQMLVLSNLLLFLTEDESHMVYIDGNWHYISLNSDNFGVQGSSAIPDNIQWSGSLFFRTKKPLSYYFELAEQYSFDYQMMVKWIFQYEFDFELMLDGIGDNDGSDLFVHIYPLKSPVMDGGWFFTLPVMMTVTD